MTTNDHPKLKNNNIIIRIEDLTYGAIVPRFSGALHENIQEEQKAKIRSLKVH